MSIEKSIEIVTTPNFRKNARSLYQKYPSLKKELLQLEDQLRDNPMRGQSINPKGDNFRVAIRKRGEHDGFNIITKVYFKVHENEKQEVLVYLADILDKVDLPKGLTKED